MRSPVALVVLLSARAAFAWPVDLIHDVEPGKERFVRVASVEWFEVEDPKVASVELMDSGEVLISGLKPGRTLVLLFSEGRFAVWRVRVGGKSSLDEAALPTALKACPGLQHHPDAVDKLVGDVKDEACRKALLALLATDAFVARDLDLTFEAKVLQGQLKGLQQALGTEKKSASVEAHYEGATLVLKGPVTLPQLRKVLWELFRRSVGRVLLDDQLEHLGTDAGSP